MKPLTDSGRPRYAVSSKGEFPEYLFVYKYISSNYSDKLIFNPNHTSGHLIDTLDLRYWKYVNVILKMCAEKNISLKILDISNNIDIDVSCIKEIKKFSESLNILIMSNCPIQSTYDLNSLTYLKHLNTLNLSNNEFLVDDTIQSIVSNCLQLQKLDLSYCISLLDKSLEYIAKYGHNILELNISNNNYYTSNGIYLIITKNDNVTHLDCSYCPKITFIGVVMNTFGMIQHMNKNNLKVLKCNNCNLKKDSLDWICSALPSLETIDISNEINLSIPQITSLLQTASYLSIINFESCKLIDSDTIILISQNCPLLIDCNYYCTCKYNCNLDE